MYCKKCGAQIDEDSVFCEKCGEKQINTFDASEVNNSESSETDKIEIGTMLYVIKPDINLPKVGCKVKVTSKRILKDGKEHIFAKGPYKPDGTPISKVGKYYTVDLSKFSINPPTQEAIKDGNARRRRLMLSIISVTLAVVIVIGIIYSSNSSSGNSGGGEVQRRCETYYSNGYGERRQCSNVALENGRYCKKHTCKIEGCYNEAWELSGTCSEHSHLR